MRIVAAFQDGDERVNYAKALCQSSIKRFYGIELVEIPGTPRPFFNDMLQKASEGDGDYFGWINGDCQLLINPISLIGMQADVFGMRRIELGTGEKCGGVDGYIIKKSFWNDVLSKDQPRMYVGGTHVDWWITRATQKFGKYDEGFYLAHIPHERTAASIGTDDYGKNNLDQYNAWADRNGISKC